MALMAHRFPPFQRCQVEIKLIELYENTQYIPAVSIWNLYFVYFLSLQ